jgi:hypothetical protein
MRSIIRTFGSELKETIQSVMRATIQSFRSELDETTACHGATKTEPDPGMMQPIEEHQEVPKGEASVMPVGEPRKRRWVCIWPQSAARRGKKGPGEIVDTGVSRLPPTGRFPAVQKCHGENGNSSGELGPRNTVDRERSSPPPGWGRPAVQKWHVAEDAVMEDRRSNRDDGVIRPGIILQEEPE